VSGAAGHRTAASTAQHRGWETASPQDRESLPTDAAEGQTAPLFFKANLLFLLDFHLLLPLGNLLPGKTPAGAPCKLCPSQGE